MTKILRLSPGSTRKSDFKDLYEYVIQIAEKYNPEEFHISETFNKMKEAMPQVDNLLETARKSPLTNKLTETRSNRSKYVSVIMMQLKAQSKTDETEIVAAAATLLLIGEKILSNFARKSFTTQNTHVKQFIAEVDESTEATQALATLGLVATFNKLKAIQQSVNSTFSNRLSMNTVRKKKNTNNDKRALYHLMTNLFVAIEGAVLEYPALDYEPLIDELNQVIKRQRVATSLRSTIAAKLNKESSTEETKVS